ncbi:MAG: 16S rRNA pseudouridine(516) synthase [Lentisphaeria bacterium]|nr:16S rRNA pseudouridine(516) synthase [Lentisphaeria bacterium]
MRLDKFLSESSSYSRREIRLLVKTNRIIADGKCVKSPDEKVDENSVITVKGVLIPYRKYIYLMLNKPQGYLSATEDDHDPVVTELVPEELQHYKVFPVGRLDKDTEGLLLLTNDGQFDHALMSPRKEVKKRYFAILDAPAEKEDVEKFASGMDLGDFTAKSAVLEITEDPRKVFIEISEGKFHQVKRMCEKVGKNVLFLKRVAIGKLLLDNTLSPGQCRELTKEELELFS